MRKVKAIFSPGCEARVHRVVSYTGMATEWTPELQFLVMVRSDAERFSVQGLLKSGLGNLAWAESASLQDGDVVVPQADKGEAIVLLRESDTHRALHDQPLQQLLLNVFATTHGGRRQLVG